MAGYFYNHFSDFWSVDMSHLTISIVLMLLNGWFAKINFERNNNFWGWMALVFSAYELSRVLQVLDSLS